MDEQRWEKLAAYTGVVAVVLWGVAYLLPGTPPASDAAAGEVLAWATDKRDSILLSAFIGGVGGVAFLWWLGSLRAYLRSSEGGSHRLSDVVFGAGILTFAASSGAYAFSVAGVMRLPEGGDAALTQLMYDGSTIMYTASWFPSVAFAAAVGVLTMRHSAFPKWFGYLSYVVAIGSLLPAYGLGATSGALAPDGAVTMAVYAISSIWYVAIVVLVIQRAGKTAAA